jgi:hypothetical protein
MLMFGALREFNLLMVCGLSQVFQPSMLEECVQRKWVKNVGKNIGCDSAHPWKAGVALKSQCRLGKKPVWHIVGLLGGPLRWTYRLS